MPSSRISVKIRLSIFRSIRNPAFYVTSPQKIPTRDVTHYNPIPIRKGLCGLYEINNDVEQGSKLPQKRKEKQ
jgi:hypothetical protein